jgi:hypothetical protein
MEDAIGYIDASAVKSGEPFETLEIKDGWNLHNRKQSHSTEKLALSAIDEGDVSNVEGRKERGDTLRSVQTNLPPPRPAPPSAQRTRLETCLASQYLSKNSLRLCSRTQ